MIITGFDHLYKDTFTNFEFMKRTLLNVALVVGLCSCTPQEEADEQANSDVMPNEENTDNENVNNNTTMNFHSFTMTDLMGNEINMAGFAGKKLLVVNTASECGNTPQYEQLQELYNQYGGDGFEIIGFPANNFGGQEPGSDSEIAEFCTKNYGVTFTMMSKISVKGDDQHELYQWLTQKAKNGVEDVEMLWNFQKFMIDEEGNFAGWQDPGVLPADEVIVSWIKS